jgi:cell division septum initiation protein DivIVA
MGSRDHSHICRFCGKERGGMNDVVCGCSRNNLAKPDPATEIARLTAERDAAVKERDAERTRADANWQSYLRARDAREFADGCVQKAQNDRDAFRMERDLLASRVGELEDRLRVSEEQNDALGSVNEAQVKAERMRPILQAVLTHPGKFAGICAKLHGAILEYETPAIDKTTARGK